MIEDFKQLADLAKQQKEKKINSLFDQMYEEEGNKKQSEIDLADHIGDIDDIEETIEEITKMMNYDDAKSQEMQEMIEESKQLLAEKQASGEKLSGKDSKLEKNLSEELKAL